MKRTFALSTALLLALSACGGGEPAETGGDMGEEAPAGEMEAEAPATASQELQTPDWYQYDEAANTVTLDIVAGETPDINHWNYNGYGHGEITVVVPVGAQVTINFSNQDPNLAHSIGVAGFSSNPPANLQPDPVFDGAISTNPTDMTAATMTGESETVTFTASQAGEYALACYIPGHAVSGMWIGFTVSDAGEAGVRGMM
jgi:sulfocyanin